MSKSRTTDTGTVTILDADNLALISGGQAQQPVSFGPGLPANLGLPVAPINNTLPGDTVSKSGLDIPAGGPNEN